MTVLLPSMTVNPLALAADTPSVANTSWSPTVHQLHQLLHEDLARAHMQSRLEEAARSRQARRLLVAKRAVRRAERANARARHAMSLASML